MDYRELMGLVGASIGILIGSTAVFITLKKPIAATLTIVAASFLGMVLIVLAIVSVI
jgi:hypothetical protein